MELIIILLAVGLMGVTTIAWFRKTKQCNALMEQLRQRNLVCDNLSPFFTYGIDLLCIADIEGNFIKLNPQWENLLGYPLNELEGMPFISFVHPDDVEKTRQLTKQLKNQSKVLSFTNRYCCKDGSFKWLEWRSYTVGDKVYASARDITDRIVAENAHLKSEEKYRSLFKNIGSGFAFHEMVFDEVGNPVDFKYINVNDRFKEVWQVDDTIIGRTVLETFPFAEKSWVDKAWAVIQTGKTLMREFHMPNDQSVESIEFKVDETHFAVIISDISERIKSSQALRESESRFRLMVDNMPLALGVCTMDGDIQYTNKRFFDYFGYHQDEVSTIEKWIRMAYPDDEIRNHYQQLWQHDINGVLEKGGTYSDLRVYPIRAKSGKMLDVEISFSIIGNELFVLFNDVTDKVKAINEVKASEQKFSDIFNLSPDMVGITRISDGVILTGNPMFGQLTGFSPVEYIGKSTLDIGLWADVNDRSFVLNELKNKGEILNAEFGMRIKNGSVLTCLFSARRILFNEESCLIFVVHDISERKINEEKIKINEIRLEKAQVVGKIGYSEQILGENRIWTSAQGMGIYGFPLQEGYLPVGELAALIPDFNKIVETFVGIRHGQRLDIEFAINPADGSPQRYIHAVADLETDAEGKPYKVISTFQDVSERKKAEDALKKSEAQIRGIAQNIPGLIFQFTVNADNTYHISYVSERSLAFLGIEDTPLEHTFERFVDGLRIEDLPEFMATIQHAITTFSKWEFEGRYVKPSGTELFLKGISQPRMLDDRLVFDGIIFDVTESKKAQKELDEIRAILSTALQQTPIPMVILSLPDFVLQMANQASSVFLGIDDEPSRIGKSLIDLRPTWQDFDANGNPVVWTDSPLLMAVHGEEVKNREYFVQRKDGSIRWGSFNTSVIRNREGDIIAVYMVFPDITEQKKSEEKIRQQGALHQTILDTVSVGLAFVKSRKYVWINQSFSRIFGYDYDEIVKNTAPKHTNVMTEYLEADGEGYRQLLSGNILSKEVEVKRKDGSVVWVSVLGKALNKNDLSEGSVWMMQDITEQKRVFEALRESERNYRDIFNASSDAFLISEITTGRLIDVNDAMLKL